jgi:hypothetical protein
MVLTNNPDGDSFTCPKISFVHPVTKDSLSIIAPVPQSDLERYIKLKPYIYKQ